jgi:hypothetical protein
VLIGHKLNRSLITLIFIKFFMVICLLRTLSVPSTISLMIVLIVLCQSDAASLTPNLDHFIIHTVLVASCIKVTSMASLPRISYSELLVTNRKAASECKNAVYSFFVIYENNLVSNGSTGAFYRYANKKLYTKSSISPLLRSEGSYPGDPSEKAELLQEAFTKNYTFDNGVLPMWDYSIMPTTPNCKLTHVFCSATMVRRAVKKRRLRTNGGPDGIPSSFFINCCEDLCSPLSQFFTVSFEHGIIQGSMVVRINHTTFQNGHNS